MKNVIITAGVVVLGLSMAACSNKQDVQWEQQKQLAAQQSQQHYEWQQQQLEMKAEIEAAEARAEAERQKALEASYQADIAKIGKWVHDSNNNSDYKLWKIHSEVTIENFHGTIIMNLACKRDTNPSITREAEPRANAIADALSDRVGWDRFCRILDEASEVAIQFAEAYNGLPEVQLKQLINNYNPYDPWS